MGYRRSGIESAGGDCGGTTGKETAVERKNDGRGSPLKEPVKARSFVRNNNYISSNFIDDMELWYEDISNWDRTLSSYHALRLLVWDFIKDFRLDEMFCILRSW